MKSEKTAYVCTECGYKNAKWYGRCPECDSFNTFEQIAIPVTSSKRPSVSENMFRAKSSKLDVLDTPDYIRLGSGMQEFDRVLGGGLVNGSAVLLSGEPGIGKSTLLMQLCGAIGNEQTVLYVSGEESGSQLKLRAKRLGVTASELFVLNETSASNIMAEIDEVSPDVVIIDSIQTVFADISSSSPGSVTQVRESSMLFINKAKNEGFSLILVGHVNKEGGIAGPKVLEHMVDAVLYFEGEKQHSYRIIRAVKNRFGSTNEIGVFEMTERGLEQVQNPSEAMLKERPKGVSGSCAVCVMEGTRPLITEIQALVTPTVYPSPKRAANGMDYNRMCLLLAVLEKRLGLHFSQHDVYVNVTGGISLSEPAADMAVCLALISGILDRPLSDDFLCFGEIGLSGECRSVSVTDQRINEAARLGFKKIAVPKRAQTTGKDVEIHGVKNLLEAIRIPGVFAKKDDKNDK
jgi:DNA repair protein RadA/Sms